MNPPLSGTASDAVRRTATISDVERILGRPPRTSHDFVPGLCEPLHSGEPGANLAKDARSPG